MDMLCIGNNLFDQEQEMAGIAQSVEQCLLDQTLAGSAIEQSIARVRSRKALVAA
jgi:beta-N-acetylhexosaminidase